MNLFNKHYYKYFDKRDTLIKFMINQGFFDSRLLPICKYYRKDNNSREHIVNECPNKFFTNLINEYIKLVNEYFNLNQDKLNLNEAPNKIYFKPKS